MDYKIHLLDIHNPLQNYIWLIEHLPSQQAVVIDPTEAQYVTDFCQTHNLTLTQIWLTHWHKDHIGGVPQLMQQYQVRVYGPRKELSKIPYIDHPLQDEQSFQFQDLNIAVLEVPGHTLGHIVYLIQDLHSLFCGDMLFAMGCGRVFEGTFEQMYQSLNRLAVLPPNTLVYCTHEYTLSNAQFARHVEPDNLAIQQRFEQVQAERAQGIATLPSSIELELKTNPFLRAATVAEFQHLRELKDQF